MLWVLRRRPFDQANRNAFRVALAPILCAEVFAIQIHPIACEEHEASQMSPILDNFVKAFHHPTAETFPLILREDVHVSEICESDIVGNHPHEPDLSGTSLACICEPAT